MNDVAWGAPGNWVSRDGICPEGGDQGGLILLCPAPERPQTAGFVLLQVGNQR